MKCYGLGLGLDSFKMVALTENFRKLEPLALLNAYTRRAAVLAVMYWRCRVLTTRTVLCSTDGLLNSRWQPSAPCCCSPHPRLLH